MQCGWFWEVNGYERQYKISAYLRAKGSTCRFNLIRQVHNSVTSQHLTERPLSWISTLPL